MEITQTDVKAVHDEVELRSDHHEAKLSPSYALGYIGGALLLAESAGFLDAQGLPNSKDELARAALRRALEMYRSQRDVGQNPTSLRPG